MGGTTAGASGILSMVGTPIGNLDDASPRVLATLRGASVICCEDTRVTSKLLARFQIRVPLVRADENVLAERVAEVVARVEAGERGATVSFAEPVRTVAPGQSVVVYDDLVCLGGGIVQKGDA